MSIDQDALAAQMENLRADSILEGSADNKEVNLDVILDVPVTLSMEVGRTRVPIRNLLQLNQGSVVELDRAAGEPLDVFVNGTLIAHGSVRAAVVVLPGERPTVPRRDEGTARPRGDPRRPRADGPAGSAARRPAGTCDSARGGEPPSAHGR